MSSDLQDTLQASLNFYADHTWAQALVIVIASLLFAWMFDRLIVSKLKYVANMTRFAFDKRLIDLLHGPIYQSIILFGLALAVQRLGPPDPFEFIIYSSLKSIAWLIWSLLLLRVTKLFLRHFAENDRPIRMLRRQTLPLFENIANILVFVFSTYIIFSAWHIDMTAWLASAGIVGIAVGFAAKDTLANLFSGVFIMADRPYKIGDYVVLESGERGEVTHIGIRSTRLLTRDDIEIVVPNSVMGNTMIINESGGGAEKSRIRIAVGVAYGSDIDKVREVLTGIAVNEESVCQYPAPRVRFRNFGGSSLDFELLCWIDQPVLRGRVKDTLYCLIYKRFIQEAIEIPYSKHDLYIKEFPKSSGESVVTPPK